jgi:hypothetical protein
VTKAAPTSRSQQKAANERECYIDVIFAANPQRAHPLGGRVTLALLIRGMPQKSLLVPLGFKKPFELTRWLQQNSFRTSQDERRIQIIGAKLGVPAEWLRADLNTAWPKDMVIDENSLSPEILSSVVIAAVQLVAAIKAHRSVPAFLRDFPNGHFVDVLPVTAEPFPCLLDDQHKEFWFRCADEIRFIPPEVSSGFKSIWGQFAQRKIDPERLLNGPCMAASLAVCAFAKDWAGKTLKMQTAGTEEYIWAEVLLRHVTCPPTRMPEGQARTLIFASFDSLQLPPLASLSKSVMPHKQDSVPHRTTQASRSTPVSAEVDQSSPRTRAR